MIKLMPHQVKALDEMFNGAVLAGGVGSGKSMVAIAYAMELIRNAPGTSITIVTTARKRDSLEWEGDFAKFGVDPETVSLQVISWNALNKHVKRKGFWIFDEHKVGGSGAWSKGFLKVVRAGNPWIMLSATPGDVWMDWVSVFLAHGFYENRTEFIEHHVVFDRFSKFPKVKKYIGTRKLERLRRRVLVEMPMERKTTRMRIDVAVDHDKAQVDRMLTTRFNEAEGRPYKDAGELFIAYRKVTLNDESRAAALADIVRKRHRVIVFYQFTFERDLIETWAEGEGWNLGELSGRRHDPIPEGDSWVYMVQYGAGAEAWNCTTCDTVVFFSLNYSWRVMEQSEGRIDRLDTPFEILYYYRLISDSKYDEGVQRANREKRMFNERAFVEQTFA